MVVETLDGRRVRHESDGRMTRHDVEITKEEVDGKIHLNISGPSRKEISRHLPGLVRHHAQLEGVDLMSHAVGTKEYNSSPMEISLGFGGLAAGRSIVKSCAAVAHVAGVRLDDLEQAREYLRGKDAPCFGYYNETDVVSNRPERVFFHCVHVMGNESTGKVVGYVEYFGYIRIVVMLSDEYRGPRFAETYVVDPITGKDTELSVNLPDFTMQDIQDIYDYKKVDYEVWRKAIEPLVESYVETSRKREIRRVVDEAFDYACEKLGVKPEEPMTDEEWVRFSNLLAADVTERLMAFVLHQ